MILSLKQNFSSAHLYHQPLWSAEENLQHFGRCHTEYGHGHNYQLEVGFKITEENLKDRSEKYQDLLKTLCNKLDHEHLNFVIPEFKTKNPTTENIALYFLGKLKETLSEKDLSYIRLYETTDLWTEIRL